MVRLPVYLDATCSGLQHISAIIKDLTLARNVNLVNSDNVQLC